MLLQRLREMLLQLLPTVFRARALPLLPHLLFRRYVPLLRPRLYLALQLLRVDLQTLAQRLLPLPLVRISAAFELDAVECLLLPPHLLFEPPLVRLELRTIGEVLPVARRVVELPADLLPPVLQGEPRKKRCRCVRALCKVLQLLVLLKDLDAARLHLFRRQSRLRALLRHAGSLSDGLHGSGPHPADLRDIDHRLCHRLPLRQHCADLRRHRRDLGKRARYLRCIREGCGCPFRLPSYRDQDHRPVEDVPDPPADLRPARICLLGDDHLRTVAPQLLIFIACGGDLPFQTLQFLVEC